MSARNSQRPDSRASTTSATSQQHDAHSMSGQLATTSAPATYIPANQSMMHYQSTAIPKQPQQYDANIQQNIMSNNHAQTTSFSMQPMYSTHDSPYLQQSMILNDQIPMGSVPIQPAPEVSDDRRRKGSAVTATNDKELREMLSRNQGRPLREVAQEVIQKERTPMAEKTKQLFAMLWLRAVCKPAKTSVPRNRVYSQYATRCGTERVVPLNPASFGKLVRVIFPGIQTRRLGVRGESKYHYVDLALEEEEHPQSSLASSWPSAALSRSGRQRSQSMSTQHLDFNNIPRLAADTAAFPSLDNSPDMQQPSQAALRGLTSRGQTFVYPDIRGMQPGTVESLSYSHTLCFPSSSVPMFSENEPVNLPLIHPYLPPRVDPDAAEALSALYRTHCTSLIDSIRFCKEKQFFRLYTSFHGTLTVPVQKLFTHPNLAPWIEQCDLVMYRTMVRFVSRLTLQAAPVLVINVLSNISSSLHNHISKTFAAQPPHVLEAKLRPATVFAGLLYRLIRVNQSAHAAANLLTIDQNREQMWHEWATMVNPKRVMEAELPDCGYEETYKILTTEVRSLLEPLQAPPLHEDVSSSAAFYNFDTDSGNFASFLQEQTAPPSRSGPSQVSTENVLDRWSAFLSSLPARFPRASARTILHCISSVGTAALRDITIMSGQSYGHWWVLKIFVDEMALWLAEMGGFLEPTLSYPSPSSGDIFQSPVMENGNGRSQSGSRMSSIGPSGSFAGRQPDSSQPLFPPEQTTQSFTHHHSYSAPPQATGLSHAPPQQNSGLKQHQHHNQHEPDLDDSGIGLSLLDDELKYVATTHMGLPMPVTDMTVDSL